jgi:hypothetical protein
MSHDKAQRNDDSHNNSHNNAGRHQDTTGTDEDRRET